MALAKGSASTDAVEFAKYVGVAPVHILAVNPTKAELEKIYGRTLERDPEYVGEIEVNGSKVANVRIDFIVKAMVEGIDLITKMSVFIRKDYRYNGDKTKVQVIDKYGRTAWVTVEQCKNKEVPIYSNGNPANIDSASYRPALIGEAELTDLIRNYVNIPNADKWADGKVAGLIDNPEEAECRLDEIQKYFSGDFKELKDIVKLVSDNQKMKVMFGVRTKDGKQFQVIYTNKTLRNSAQKSSYAVINKDIQNRKNNGGLSDTEFDCDDIHEYTVQATDFTKKENTGNKGSEDFSFGEEPF